MVARAHARADDRTNARACVHACLRARIYDCARARNSVGRRQVHQAAVAIRSLYGRCAMICMHLACMLGTASLIPCVLCRSPMHMGGTSTTPRSDTTCATVRQPTTTKTRSSACTFPWRFPHAAAGSRGLLSAPGLALSHIGEPRVAPDTAGLVFTEPIAHGAAHVDCLLHRARIYRSTCSSAPA